MTADLAAWRTLFPERGPRLDEHIVQGYLPPHITVTGLNGDVVALLTAHGRLAPPRDNGTQEAERFLSDAAATLPDAAHLDLIGEHLFFYVYDSPDPRHPFLIGNKQVKGDIHQTALQTLATVSGGICRGDCDDLAELYQEIAERQGRTAHVITLPAHAAVAWAEQRDSRWHVFVLQTGQPREFSADTLQESLRQAYLSFDESDNFDPNGLGLLLRFSGENTRSGWRLSWRIFAEPSYAATMIDVQKDWHYQTYQSGIIKMQRLIADGDHDTANYRELSGLADFTGQYDMAVEYHQKALDKTDEPESQLYSAAELVMHLFRAKQDDRAHAVALDLIDNQLPALQDQMGPRAMQFGFQLAGILNDGKAYDLAERVIRETLIDELTKQIDQVGQWLTSPQFNARRWQAAEQLRRIQQIYVTTCLALVEGRGRSHLPGDETHQRILRNVQDWLNTIAFRDVDEEEDVLHRYATAGAYYAAVLGRDQLLAMLDLSVLPTAQRDHTARVGGAAQIAADLPWIRLSVPFWANELMRLFERERDSLDRDLALTLADRLAESHAAAKAMGLEHNRFDHYAHLGAVIAALLREDEQALRARLQVVRDRNDKRLRDDTAQWLGDTARFLDKAWYGRVIQAWVDELDYKPKYYWIAWRAALAGAPDHALMVAKVAADRFADDPDFQEEHRFMAELFARQDAEADADPTVDDADAATPAAEATVAPAVDSTADDDFVPTP